MRNKGETVEHSHNEKLKLCPSLVNTEVCEPGKVATHHCVDLLHKCAQASS